MSAEAYGRMLRALLPPGRLWRQGPIGVLLSKLFLACGDELERIEARGRDLIEEADPRTAVEMLPEYEKDLDLVASGTLEERRARVMALLLLRQRYRPVDFQTALAPVLGQDAEDVVVIERGRAFALAAGDDREIFRFFIYRDPSLPGSYDLAAAQDIVGRIKPSHTHGHVIQSIQFLVGDPFSLTKRDLIVGSGGGGGGVTTDGPDDVFMPESAADFTALGEDAPQHLWLPQNPSGNLTDVIGSLTLSAANGPTYSQAVTGWTRVAVGLAETTNRFIAASGVGPSPATTSQLWVAVLDFPSLPGSTRPIMGMGGTSSCDARMLTTGRIRFVVDGVTADGTEDHVTGGARILAVLLDRTVGRAAVYTDLEKIVGTYSAGVNDGNKGFGLGTTTPQLLLHGFMFEGAPAEKSDAEVKALFEALGWTVPWS